MRDRVGWVLLAAAAAWGCARSNAGSMQPGQPVETRAPNAEGQRPAFPGQTRANFAPARVAFEVRVVARGLDKPWAVAPLPAGGYLVTEKGGRLRLVSAGGAISAPLAGLPAVDARNQGGLLDVVLDPAFGENGRVYWSYSEPREGGNGTAVARAQLVAGPEPRLEGVQVIWRMRPTLDSTMHFGSRLVFTRDGDLLVTTGERSILEGRRHAQRLDSAFGKIVRLRPDGTVPPGNPFANREGALPEIWSYGHRNIQSAALHPDTGELWVVDHGPKGGDELNRVRPGVNYGWPVITYGEEYSGAPVGEGLTARAGMEQPVYYWDPVIAPSGMAIYDADLFSAWKGSLFVGALAAEHLVRLTMEGTRVVGEERLLVDRGRIRDVRVSPAGTLLVLDESNGELLELVPPGTR